MPPKFKWIKDCQYLQQRVLQVRNCLIHLKPSLYFFFFIFWHKKVEIGPKNELLARLNTSTFADNLGNRPLKWLDIRFKIVEFKKMSGTSLSMWLLERSTLWMFEIQSQNQLGALPETPDKGTNKNQRDLIMCILQDRVIDKFFFFKKTQPIATRLFVVISYDIFHKTFEAISCCHKVICCNKEVIASTCLLQYLGFIAMRFFSCINLLP